MNRLLGLARVALVVPLAVACTSSATPPSSAAASSAPAAKSAPLVSAVPSASPTQSTPARIQVADTLFPNTVSPYLLFQLPGESRLRAISFGAEQSGVLPAQLAANVVWRSSPYGAPFIVGTTAYDREGRALGTVPWPPKGDVRWSTDGRFMCQVVPERPATGATLRLERAVIGEAAKVVASGFGVYGDNSVQSVLACDETTDRAVVAVFGQGVAPLQLWVFRLSTGAIIRSVDYRPGLTAVWVAASADGSLVAETEQSSGQRWKVTIRRADDGAGLATLDDVIAQGFSGDNSLLVASIPGGAIVLDWKTARRVWSDASGQYGGYLAEPAGSRLAVGVGFSGGSERRDVYLIDADGRSVLLPAMVRVSLRY